MAELNRVCSLLSATPAEGAIIAAAIAAARPRRTGWQQKVATEALMRFRREMEEATRTAASAAWRAAKDEKKDTLAAKLAAEDVIAAENGGYVLRDVNRYYYNCGHYPEWVVSPASAGQPAAFVSRDLAQAAADRGNKRSNAAWHAFLDG